MKDLSSVTLGDVAKGFGRYRPFIVAVAAVVLVATVLPGRHGSSTSSLSTGSAAEQAAGASPSGGPATAADGTPLDQAATGTASGTGTGTGTGGPGSSGGRVGGGGAVTGGGAGAGATSKGGATPGGVAAPAPKAPAFNLNGTPGPDCDTSTGRLKMPSLYAPPCVPAFSGPNGGATSMGVTGDTITIVRYVPQADPTTKAILVAGGDTDDDSQVTQQYLDFIDLFQHHVETYGRKVKMVDLAASGNATDDAAAKADAIKVATQYKAFMSWGAPGGTNAYVNELTARKVMCLCTTTLPKDFYLAHAPYVWGTGLPDENQAYQLRAEYIGKRLQGHKAKNAGDPTIKLADRKFGLIYYETTDKSYAAGEKFFEQELGKYGVTLRDKAAYIFDTAQAQDQASTIIGKFASEGITSVIFVGDPIYPVFYTAAANKQAYQPEWIITGSALTDTTFFARTYDKSQWSHAFGISLLAARGPKEQGDAYKLLQWHTGKAPVAPGSFGVIFPTIYITYVGIEMAGPNLNPLTFKAGMFAAPISPTKPAITLPTASWGRHLTTWDDYNLYDDATEIWWDNAAQGPDELGNNGVGMYRYVLGGKRYRPGEIPSGEPTAFDTNGTVTVYDNLPPSDRAPSYPHAETH